MYKALYCSVNWHIHHTMLNITAYFNINSKAPRNAKQLHSRSQQTFQSHNLVHQRNQKREYYGQWLKMASQFWIFEHFHWKLEYHIGLQQIELKHFESFATANSVYVSWFSRFCRQSELKRLTKRSEQLPNKWCCNFESIYGSQRANLSLNQIGFLNMVWINNAFQTLSLSKVNPWYR